MQQEPGRLSLTPPFVGVTFALQTVTKPPPTSLFNISGRRPLQNSFEAAALVRATARSHLGYGIPRDLSEIQIKLSLVCLKLFSLPYCPWMRVHISPPTSSHAIVSIQSLQYAASLQLPGSRPWRLLLSTSGVRTSIWLLESPEGLSELTPGPRSPSSVLKVATC